MSTTVGHLIDRDEHGRLICCLCDGRFKPKRGQMVGVGAAVALCAPCLARCDYDPSSIERALVYRYRFLRGLPIERRDPKCMRHLARVHLAVERYAQPD